MVPKSVVGPKMQHEKKAGCFIVGEKKYGNGLGRSKMHQNKGLVACCMVPKHGYEWAGKGWEGLGRAQNEA